MKRIFLFTLLTIMTFTVFSQEDHKSTNNNEIKTIFGKNLEYGGYGGISINYGDINKKDALLMGVKGGWIINHSFVLGIGGYGFVNDIHIDNIKDGEGFNLAALSRSTTCTRPGDSNSFSAAL